MERTMRRRMGATAAALALAAGGIVLAGCGGSDSATTTASTAAATSADTIGTTAQADNGISTMSGTEILDRSVAAAKAASSVKVSGSITQGSQSVSLDLTLSEGRADGTVTVKGVEVAIRVVDGKTYLKAPKELFAQMGASGEAVGTLLGDKWFTIPASGLGSENFKGFEQLTNKDALFSSLVESSSGKSIAVGDATTVDGTPAILLTGAKDGTLAIATVGEPYPLQVKGKNGSGQVTFSGWNAPVSIAAPADPLDFGAIAGGASTTGSATTTG